MITINFLTPQQIAGRKQARGRSLTNDERTEDMYTDAFPGLVQQVRELEKNYSNMKKEVAGVEKAYNELQMQLQQAQLSGLGFKISLKKIIPKFIRKIKVFKAFTLPARLAIAPLAAAVGLKPKALGFKGGSIVKHWKTMGTVTRIGGAIVGAAVFGPAIAGFIGKGASVVWGGMKFVGGRLASVPMSLIQGFKGSGAVPQEATPEEAAKQIQGFDLSTIGNMAKQVGLISDATQAQVQMPESYLSPEAREMPEDRYQGSYQDQYGEKAEADILGGLGNLGQYIPLIIGGAVLLMLSTGYARPVELQRQRK